jgi:pimeloyl-ACP methyl ester carboxylesterase
METTRKLITHSIETVLFDEGDGPPLVMLHGMAATSDIWRYSFDALKDRYRVIAPDLPGHGRSEGSAMPYGLRFYTRWLDDLLDQLGIRQTAIAGNSMGGAIGLAYTLDHPERVDRLVMVDALGLGPDLPGAGIGHVLRNLPNFVRLLTTRRMDPYLFRYLRGLVIVDPQGPARPVLEEMFRLNLKQGPLGFWSAWAGVRLLLEDFISPSRRREFNQRLGSIDVPTLIAWGLHDGLLPVRNAEAGQQNLPHARLEVFTQSAHSPMLEEPERFAEVVATFLDGSTDAVSKQDPKENDR